MSGVYPPLTPAERSQSWMGEQSSTALPVDLPLCNVQIEEASARPWLLTLYSPTSDAGQFAPRAMVPPIAGVAVTVDDVAVDAVAKVTIGRELVVIDWPARGAVYQVSPCSQLNVQLLSTWAGGVPPQAVPRWAARITESPARAGVSLHEMPTYTVRWPGTDPGVSTYSTVPTRAVAVSVVPGDMGNVGAGSDPISVVWVDGAGADLGQFWVSPSLAALNGLGPFPVPRGARQYRVVGAPAEVYSPLFVFHLSL